MNYGYLAYPDIPEGAVHVLPLGAVEPHGPHAPLVTDTLISIGVCHRAAKRLEGEIPVLVLPPVHYGVTRYAGGVSGHGVDQRGHAALARERDRRVRRDARPREQPLRARAGGDAALDRACRSST